MFPLSSHAVQQRKPHAHTTAHARHLRVKGLHRCHTRGSPARCPASRMCVLISPVTLSWHSRLSSLVVRNRDVPPRGRVRRDGTHVARVLVPLHRSSRVARYCQYCRMCAACPLTPPAGVWFRVCAGSAGQGSSVGCSCRVCTHNWIGMLCTLCMLCRLSS